MFTVKFLRVQSVLHLVIPLIRVSVSGLMLIKIPKLLQKISVFTILQGVSTVTR